MHNQLELVGCLGVLYFGEVIKVSSVLQMNIKIVFVNEIFNKMIDIVWNENSSQS